MKYTLINLSNCYVPDEFLEQMPDESTIIAVLGADLENIEPEIEIISGQPKLVIGCDYEGPVRIPEAAELIEKNVGENYNAIWYVSGRSEGAREIKEGE